MRKYACVDDIGNMINPLIVAGQVHGGLVQGIAQALFEEAVYDDAGTLVSGSFVDYLVPTAADMISFDVDHTTTPSLTNTLGTKGVGEAGTIASTPAVVNAVVDAVRQLRRQRRRDAVHARAGLEGDPLRTTAKAARPPRRATRRRTSTTGGHRRPTPRTDGAGQ